MCVWAVVGSFINLEIMLQKVLLSLCTVFGIICCSNKYSIHNSLHLTTFLLCAIDENFYCHYIRISEQVKNT